MATKTVRYLIQYLKENSSGGYRPCEEAAEVLGDIADTLALAVELQLAEVVRLGKLRSRGRQVYTKAIIDAQMLFERSEKAGVASLMERTVVVREQYAGSVHEYAHAIEVKLGK